MKSMHVNVAKPLGPRRYKAERRWKIKHVKIANEHWAEAGVRRR